MSVFQPRLTITLPAAGTTEVTGTLPAGTNAVIVVCTMPGSSAFQYPSYSVGFATGTGNQMAAGMNPMFRTGAGTQQGNAQWNNAAVGFASESGVPTARIVSVTTLAGTTLGLTKNGATFADVTCTVYPIVASSTPDLVEGTGLSATGTALTRTGLAFQPGALLFLSSCVPGVGASSGSRLMLGMATSGASQWGMAGATSWDLNPTDAASRVRTDRVGLMYETSGGAISYIGQFAVGSVTSGGYTITQTNNMFNRRFAVLAIPGTFALLTGAVPAATGLQSTTGAPFTPSSGLFALSAFATANDTQVDSFSLSLGGGTVGGQGFARIQNPDNTSTPQPTVAALGGAVLQGADASGQTSLANIDAFLADGVRLNWTDAHSTAGLWAALVSGGAPPPSGPSAAAIHDYLTLNGLVPFGV